MVAAFLEYLIGFICVVTLILVFNIYAALLMAGIISLI